MTSRETGQRPVRYAWTKAWLRELPDEDLAIFSELARQQIEAHAKMTQLEEKRARRTIAEQERRHRLADPEALKAATMTG